MTTLQTLQHEAVKAKETDTGMKHIYGLLTEDEQRIVDIFLTHWLKKAYEAGEPEHLREFAKRIEDLQDTNFPDLNQSLGYAMAIKDVLQRLYVDITNSQRERNKV